jgi:amino acid adenylation domain-containing protein
MNSYPLSFPQRMFWLLEQLEPEIPAYNLPRSLKIEGVLDVDALRGALAATLNRHEVLRTSFLARDGELFQRVHDEVAIDLTSRDLSHVPASARQSEALAIAGEEGRKPFDLEVAPLMRALLLRLGSEEHLLVLVLHHIITDGWSMSILFKELAQFYGQFALAQPSQLASLPIRYSDFSCWQQEQLRNDAWKNDLEFWQNKLRGCEPLLTLPTDRPRPPVQSQRGSAISFTVDKRLADRFKLLCRREDVTLYMGLLALFEVLLLRYTSKDDIVVGTPVAGRDDEQVSGLIGCFVNTVVIRGDLTGNPRFRELLQRVRIDALDAYAHRTLPFEQLLAKLKCERDASYTPLFQIMFVLHNEPEQVIRLPGLTIEELEFESGLAKFDLTLDVVDRKDNLYCQLEYRTDLFKQSTVERLARHFQNLLASAVEDPACPIAALSMLEATEERRLLFDWNATSAEYRSNLKIGHAFDEQVLRTPDAVALTDQAQRVTYRELQHRANQVARELIDRGVGIEMPVGVYVKRSIDAIVAILGALKAGALYVPLDTAQPSRRLELLIRISGCRLVLTQRAVMDNLPQSVEPVLLDADEVLWATQSGSSPAIRPIGRLAYIIFTSGSTGEPKGVVGTHRATMNRLEWMYREFPFSAGEMCCQKTALGFVDSIWEMFGPLLAGIPSVIIPEELVVDPALLLGLLDRERVTRIVLVPTLLRVLLDHAPRLGSELPRLKLWTVSGEYLPLDLAKRFGAACPDAVLLNLYGSSEVAGDATFHRVGELDGTDAIPIGKPIANTQVYILDAFCRPVPVGVAGTLHVGGDCLSEGYWHRPDLTSERFVANPFGAHLGRLFDTGDRARWLADGTIEYLGRLDTQVKIRGFRVELGEIEANLQSHPAVEQAVVVVSGTAPDKQRLGAYVVGRDGSGPDPEALRSFLRPRLPQHMIPAYFHAVRELPLLPSGKVDRRALPEPPMDSGATGAERIGPRNEVEHRLAAIWRELLDVEELGVTDNFFSLGGNSLLAMRTLARVRRAFEVEVPIRSLFDRPSIEELAEAIGTAKAEGAVPRIAPIVPRAGPSANIESLVTELGKLSQEQIDALLRQVRG